MSNLKEILKNSDNPVIKLMLKFHHILWCLKMEIKNFFYKSLYYFFRIFPIKQNKIIASTFSGKKYGDNTGFIIEELLNDNPDLDIVWLKDDDYNYNVPQNIRIVSFWKHSIKRIYEYATAKVWIDTHIIRSYMRKRKGQLFIETWHGGLGIKKLHGDLNNQNKYTMSEVKNMSEIADIFISNSDHLTDIYRRAFDYKGNIWKCGYPKNDILFKPSDEIRKKVHDYFNLSKDTKILVYAPTFRDDFYTKGINIDVYDISFQKLFKTITDKFGGKWIIMVKYHPVLVNEPELYNNKYDYVVNATKYQEMQEIIIAANAFISDYSSCIFDAALRNIPCFTFAVDFEEYKGDRGVYYEMEELPFPYAKNNEELINNISCFDYKDYVDKWEKFKIRTGLYETGHAAKDIACVINEYVKGNKKSLEEIKYEEK